MPRNLRAFDMVPISVRVDGIQSRTGLTGRRQKNDVRDEPRNYMGL